ncbi:MAG: AsnC family protein [Euryarchaeota archaeon]|nr:AsnC family protein [Euryarchaeota archaeon]
MVDDLDRRIIEILQKDARTPFVEIGKAVGVSDVSVFRSC